MPAKDIFHDAVRIGLEKEGWVITDDPSQHKIMIYDPVQEVVVAWKN
jgi:hypothetical protein